MESVTRQTSGDVAAGFERVRDVFDEGAADLGSGGGAFCAYVDGEKVVDLWAGEAKPDVPWVRDTMATLMSSTKGLAALCAQILHDRGELDIEAPVATYWPEFAQAGKEAALVRHVLNHTIGVLGFLDPGSLLNWEGRGWGEYEEIAARLAASPPAWEPGSKIGYHAVSCGWLTTELVRRISGKTIGLFLRDEVSAPLDLDVWIGTPPKEQQRLADVIPESYEGLPEDLVELDRIMRGLLNRPDTLAGQAGIYMHGGSILDDIADFFNNPRVRAVEIPAVNGSATARGLASVYAMLSMGGELSGVRIVSPESVKLFGTEAASGPSALTPEVRLPNGQVVPPPLTRYALGYACNISAPEMPSLFGPTEEAFGHTGHGGQIGFADPVHRVAIGFVRNHLTLWPTFSNLLIDAVYDSTGFDNRG